MSSFITEIRQTILPRLESKDGPLPPLLVGLTVVTGLVDAFSYLLLGHVFVANMTGNVVLLGFALAGVPGFTIGGSLVALVAFWLGALIGGKVASRFGQHRGQLLNAAASIEGVLFSISVVLAALSSTPMAADFRFPLIAVLGLAMGTQNAASRKLAVPDLTTTVLTLTITGSAADSAIAGGKGSVAGRRVIAVGAMLVGALIGAAFILHAQTAYPLVLALLVIAVVILRTRVLRKSVLPWVHG